MGRAFDWLIYLAVVVVALTASLARRELVSAPRPPPPVPGAAEAPIAPASPFANTALQRLPARIRSNRGTALSMGGGVWLAASRVVKGCGAPVIVVADGWGAPVKVRGVSGDVAVLTTNGGSPALGLARAARSSPGARAYLAGFSKGGPGEAAVLHLGADNDRVRSAWAEIGRTDGLSGPLFGLAGAPVLNADGEIAGMLITDSPRRGQLIASAPEALTRALTHAGFKAGIAQSGQPITRDNYGRAANSLRRDLSVVELVCTGR